MFSFSTTKLFKICVGANIILVGMNKLVITNDKELFKFTNYTII